MEAGSQAEAAGCSPGACVVAIAGEPVTCVLELKTALEVQSVVVPVFAVFFFYFFLFSIFSFQDVS